MSAKTLKSVFLVIGISIGSGILVLPLAAPQIGFFPTIGMLLLSWAAMTLGAFYILEVSSTYKEQIDFQYLASKALGRLGTFVTMTAYLGLLWALLAIYTFLGGAWFEHCLGDCSLAVSSLSSQMLVAGIIGFALLGGIASAGLANEIVTIALVVVFCVICTTNIPHINTDFLGFGDVGGGGLLQPLATMVTSFGFAVIVPGMFIYLDRSVKLTRFVLYSGALVTLLVYFLWELVGFGVIGVAGLMDLPAGDGTSLILALENLADLNWLNLVIRYFVILAIFSSAFGVGLALQNLLLDYFGLFGRRWWRVSITLVAVVLPIFILQFIPAGLMFFMNFAGILVAVTLGVLPPVLALRLRQAGADGYRVPGGTPVAISVIVFFLVLIVAQVVLFLRS